MYDELTVCVVCNKVRIPWKQYLCAKCNEEYPDPKPEWLRFLINDTKRQKDQYRLNRNKEVELDPYLIEEMDEEGLQYDEFLLVPDEVFDAVEAGQEADINWFSERILLTNNPRELSDGIDEAIDLQIFIKSLPERERNILVWYSEGYTMEEIADKLDTYKMEISRIILELSGKYEEFLDKD